jgi:phage-related baseplate assembly protein
MSDLPEPSFVQRDIDAITQEMIADYEAATGKALQPAQVERLLINLIAYRESLLRIALQEAAKQNLVEYARYPMIDHLGKLLGVTRLQAAYATTTIRFTLVAAQAFNVTVPTGTRVETSDRTLIFATEEALTITAGNTYGDVGATCASAGEVGNGYVAAQINYMLDPVAYVACASNTTTSTDGSDAETDHALRTRIKLAPESFSNAGSKGAYRYHTLSAHPTIIDAAVTNPSAGVVNVYPLCSTGIPSGAVLTAVEDALNVDTIRPLTDTVNVIAPTEVAFTITASVTIYASADETTAQAGIEANLAAYAATMRAALGKDIVLNQILATVLKSYGVYDATLAGPVADDVLDENEWANCGTITVTIAGTANG